MINSFFFLYNFCCSTQYIRVNDLYNSSGFLETNVYEGAIEIVGMSFDTNLNNPESFDYATLSAEIENLVTNL